MKGPSLKREFYEMKRHPSPPPLSGGDWCILCLLSMRALSFRHNRTKHQTDGHCPYCFIQAYMLLCTYLFIHWVQYLCTSIHFVSCSVEGKFSFKGRWPKNEGGPEGHSNSGSVWHCGDRGLFLI